MGNGEYQGPDPWEIERAVERGYRRARGEYVPDDGSGVFNKTCCCLVPAILLAIMIAFSIAVQVWFLIDSGG